MYFFINKIVIISLAKVRIVNNFNVNLTDIWLKFNYKFS